MEKKMLRWEGDFKGLITSDYSVGLYGFSLEEARDVLIKEDAKTIQDIKDIKKVYRKYKKWQKEEAEYENKMYREWKRENKKKR